MTEILEPRLAIIGLGLIGASFARALRACGAVGAVSAYDLDPAQTRRALELGIIDRIGSSIADAADHATVVLVSVPVLQMAGVLNELRGAVAAGALITDVGSTKCSVLDDALRVFGELPPNFVAGHPIAGTEKSGVDAAFPELFRNRRVILTPHAQQAPQALERVRKLWRACGATVVEMQAPHHDTVLAATSHLPHMLAYTLVDQLAALDERDEIFVNAAGGFRDFTRIASSSPHMWHDIVRANRSAVLALLDSYMTELGRLRADIAHDDGAAILARFERARAARERYTELVERPAGGNR